MILRAKTKNLFSGKELTEKQQNNSNKNMEELEVGKTILESYPRRLVFELTNACNLNCIMCGRNAPVLNRQFLIWMYFEALNL